MITVSSLFYAPIKSAGGRWVNKGGSGLSVGPRGFDYDRRWVVVGEGNMFVAQRRASLPVPLPGAVVDALTPLGLGIEVRILCQVQPTLFYDELLVHAPNMRSLHLPLAGKKGMEEKITVWRDRELLAIDQGDEAASWFSEFLSRERPGEYRLMRMTDGCQRQSKGGTALQGFHDGYPFMMISDESLGDLNRRLHEKHFAPLPANRFRPDIWLRGCPPYYEDRLRRIRIGDVIFDGKALCDRCPITCIDQVTAVRGKEPLVTLATYRRGRDKDVSVFEKPNAVFFGRYFDHQNSGVVMVGDEVEILEMD
ncbi:MAG: MOSC domain-containing protein [Patescibacteria group bacterium]